MPVFDGKTGVFLLKTGLNRGVMFTDEYMGLILKPLIPNYFFVFCRPGWGILQGGGVG
jgi:hypothetical protein